MPTLSPVPARHRCPDGFTAGGSRRSRSSTAWRTWRVPARASATPTPSSSTEQTFSATVHPLQIAGSAQVTETSAGGGTIGQAGVESASAIRRPPDAPARSRPMKIFLDTADIEEIRIVARWGVLDGVTTNPTLFAKTSGATYEEVLKEICTITSGP